MPLPEGTVTVMFTDAEGSTALRSTLGDDGAHDSLRALEDLVVAEVERHDGVVVKSLGDGAMVAFTSARRALEAAVAIQRACDLGGAADDAAGVRVKVGLHTGEVVEQGGDLFGNAVHAAARIVSEAEGGEVLCSDVVRTLAGSVPGLAFDPRGSFSLKGFDEPWQLFAVRPARAATDGTTPTVLVGRQRERAVLRRRLDALERSAGGIILLRGAAGVGKTRLVREVVDEAGRRGSRALTAKCHERRATVPYAPVADLLEEALATVDEGTIRAALGDVAPEIARILPELRRHYPDIPPPAAIPADQERRLLFNSVIEFIRRASQDRPLLLVIDDLQWADTPSLLLVEHLAPALSDIPVAIVGTYREEAPGSRSALSATVARLVKDRLAELLSVSPFDLDGSSALLFALAGSRPPPDVATALHEATGGNPFFLEELYRDLAGDLGWIGPDGWRTDLKPDRLRVPDSVRIVLEGRLAGLDDVTRTVVAHAAVVGRLVDVDLLARVCGLDLDPLVDAVEQGERNGILTVSSDDRGTRVRFSHDLVRETLESGLNPLRRQRLHLKVADALSEGAVDQAQAQEIAEHLLAAGGMADRERTGQALLVAGRRALSGAAYEDAERLFSAAEAALTEGSRGHADAVAGLGYVRLSTRGWSAALESWRAAILEYEALGATEPIGELVTAAARELTWAGRYQETFEVLNRGLTAVGDEASVARAQILVARCFLLGVAGAFDEARVDMEEAERIASSSGDRNLAARVMEMRQGLRINTGDFVGVRQEGPTLARLLRELGHSWALSEWLAWLGVAALRCGRMDEFERLSAEVRDLAARTGSPGARLIQLRSEMLVAYLRGQLDDYVRLAREDLDVCEASGYPWSAHSHANLAWAAFLQGREEQALEHLEAGMAADIVGAWRDVPRATALLIHAHRGDGAAVDELLAGTDVPPPDAEGPVGPGPAYLGDVLIEASVLLGRADEAAGRYPGVRARLARGEVYTLFNMTLLDRLGGIAAACGGDLKLSERHFEAALRRAAADGVGLELAHVRCWYGWALLRCGTADDRRRADALIRAAAADYAAFGISRPAELVRGLVSRDDGPLRVL